MRITNEHILDRFAKRHADVDPALKRWARVAKSQSWLTPQHVRDLHSNARPIGGNRLIFNIKGNDYRLVIEVNYEKQSIRIRFIGTHAEYDRINSRRV